MHGSGGSHGQDGGHVQATYKGLPKYEGNSEEYKQMIMQLCPQYIQDRTLTIVSENFSSC